MLPDIGASELMVIALVALIFVGPKDLPAMLKKLGQFTSKMRRMAADFRTSFDDMARQSELEDLRREVEQMRASANEAISDPVGIHSTLRETMDDVDAGMIGEESLNYDPGMPVIEEPVAAPQPKPAAKRTTARKSVTADTAPKPKKSAKRVTRPKSAKAVVVEAAAKPRRRAPSKVVN